MIFRFGVSDFGKCFMHGLGGVFFFSQTKSRLKKEGGRGLMAGKGSALDCLNWEIYAQAFVGFILIYMNQVSRGYTNPGDGKSKL